MSREKVDKWIYIIIAIITVIVICILSSCEPRTTMLKSEVISMCDSLVSERLDSMQAEIDSMPETDLTEINNHLHCHDEIATDIYRRIENLYKNDSAVMMYAYRCMVQMNMIYEQAGGLNHPPENVDSPYIVVYKNGEHYKLILVKDE